MPQYLCRVRPACSKTETCNEVCTAQLQVGGSRQRGACRCGKSTIRCMRSVIAGSRFALLASDLVELRHLLCLSGDLLPRRHEAEDSGCKRVLCKPGQFWLLGVRFRQDSLAFPLEMNVLFNFVSCISRTSQRPVIGRAELQLTGLDGVDLIGPGESRLRAEKVVAGVPGSRLGCANSPRIRMLVSGRAVKGAPASLRNIISVLTGLLCAREDCLARADLLG